MNLSKRIQSYALFMLLAALLLSCNTSPMLGATGSVAGQPASASAASNPDLCANALVPIRKGATWTYVNSTGAASPVSLTTTISDVRPDGFTVATHFDDSPVADQEWACLPDGLVALSLSSAQATLGLSLQGLNASLITLNPAGITLPTHVQAGKTWEYALSVTGNVSQGDNIVQVNGKIDSTLHAVGTESVTVPAGTFNATKIQATSTFTMNADYFGLSIPVNSTIRSTFWFAPGVGWIKSVQTGDLPGMSIDSMTELQSYQIP